MIFSYNVRANHALDFLKAQIILMIQLIENMRFKSLVVSYCCEDNMSLLHKQYEAIVKTQSKYKLFIEN